MARKRLIVDPPPAISSAEKEEIDDEEEEQHGTVETQKNGAGGIDVGSSGKNVIGGGGGCGGGGGWGGVILALAKIESGKVNRKEKGVRVKKGKRMGSGEVNRKEKEVSVKKGKRGYSEQVNGEGKERNVKRQNQVVNEEMNGEEEGSEDLWEKYPFLRSSLHAEDLPNDVKKKAMVMLGKVPEENLVELEMEWRGLMSAKLEFFLKERDLIAEQVKLALDAFKSQDFEGGFSYRKENILGSDSRIERTTF